MGWLHPPPIRSGTSLGRGFFSLTLPGRTPRMVSAFSPTRPGTPLTRGDNVNQGHPPAWRLALALVLTLITAGVTIWLLEVVV